MRRRPSPGRRGQLNQHRQINACDHFDLGAVHNRDRQIRRRAAEHIGEHDDAGAGFDLFGFADDFGTALFHIVVGTDAHRSDRILRADHMFQRRYQFNREAAMGYEH